MKMFTPPASRLRCSALAALRILAAFAVCGSFTGCQAIFDVLNAYFGLPGYEQPFFVAMSPVSNKVVRGTTSTLIVTFGPGDDADRALTAVVTPSLGVTFTGPTRLDDPIAGERPSFGFTLTVAPDAPLEPFFVYAQYEVFDAAPPLPANIIVFEYRPFKVVRGIDAEPPVVTSVTPQELLVGTTTTIEIEGEHFDLNPSVNVFHFGGGVSQGALEVVSPTRLRIPVTVAEDSRTGENTFVVSTDEGRTPNLPLLIADRSGRPVLTGTFPNHAVFGVSTPVVITGDNFEAGQRLVPNTAITGAPEVTRQPVPRDRLNSVFLTNTRISGLQTYRLESPRGDAAGVIPVRGISPTGLLKAFRITQIAGEVTPGTVGQLLVTVDQDLGVAPTPFHLPTELAGSVMSNLVVFPPSVLGSGRKVLVHFEAAVTPVLGPHYLAFQATFSGFPLTSNLFPFNFTAPRANTPLVRRTTVGQIERGQVVVETIEGVNLDGARSITFSSGGVTATIPPGQTSSTQLQAIFSATGTADLTGEHRTTFKVITQRGASNEAGYLVVP